VAHSKKIVIPIFLKLYIYIYREREREREIPGQQVPKHGVVRLTREEPLF
jgi:hypothetical protein